MGQRLNIEIVSDDKVIANAYYHWSGYTSSAADLTNIIIKRMNEIQCDDITVRVIKLLELTGAGLTDQEKLEVTRVIDDYSKYNFHFCTGRNDGLIAISKGGIEETRKWEEARVTIHLSTETVDFEVGYAMSEEEYIDDYSQERFDTLSQYDFEYTFDSIPFDSFKEFAHTVMELVNKGVYAMRINDPKIVFSFIE